MDTNGSGDHHQVQAAAGRAGGGGPSSSATAATPATASSLPPPAPSATDAAVQTRARDDSDSAEDPPQWTATRHAAYAGGGAGADLPFLQLKSTTFDRLHPPPSPAPTSDAAAAPSTREQIAVASIENVHRGNGGNGEQIASAYEEMTALIEEMDDDTEALRVIPPNVSEVPLPMARMAANDLSNMVQAIEENAKNASNSGSEMDPQLPQSQMATFAEETVEDDEEHGSKKKGAPTTESDKDTPPTPTTEADALVVPPTAEEEETLQQAQDPPTPAAAQALSPPPTDQGQSPSNPRGQQQLPTQPPPQSMMPSPDEDADPPVSVLPRDPSMRMVEATLAEEQPEIPVGDAIQVAEQTCLERNKNIIIALGMGLLAFAAVAAGVSVSSNNDSGDSNSIEPSAALSTVPTPSPPLYCGEINILTDAFPEETIWEIRNTTTVRGIPYPNELVLEGAPEEEGHYTYEACLERGDYEFAIFDSSGDGIVSPGYYNVTFEGIMIAQGGEFGSEEKVYFSLPSWNRQGLGFNGDACDDLFGRAVAFSADASTVAIGAPGLTPDWDIESRQGYVRVYRRQGEGSSWEQRGNTIRGEANGDQFGRSLVLSEDGTTMFIGAPRHDSVGRDSGQVKVYEWDEAALDYVQIGDTLYGVASGDFFGYSLDISSGKILAVGAERSHANGIWSGQVTIYARDDASSNFKQRGGAINGDTARSHFGTSVSLAENGQKLAVGAPNNDSNGSQSGQVRIFEWDDAASNYEQLGDSLLGDAAGDYFGESVSFSRDGTTLAIGAPYNDENGPRSGQVKVFAWDVWASNFEQIGLSLYGNAASDYFGWSVALSSEGKTLAIGANQFNTGKPGYVEVYGWDEADREYKRLGQSLGGEASDDAFGFALTLAGNGRDLAVGTPYNDRNGTLSGRVEVFEIEL